MEDEEDVESTFDEIVKEGKNRSDFKSKAKARERKALLAPSKDEENYIPYQPSDHHSEAGRWQINLNTLQNLILFFAFRLQFENWFLGASSRRRP